MPWDLWRALKGRAEQRDESGEIMEKISAEQAVKQAPAGSMMYARIGESADQSKRQTGFLIREEPRFVKAFGKNRIVEQRGGLLHENHIALVVTMLRIGAGKDSQIYECWFDYFSNENRQSFYDLASQENFVIVFYTPARGRAIQVRNGFRDLFTRVLAVVSAQRAWSESEFDRARNRIYQNYKTPGDLWQSLANSGQA